MISHVFTRFVIVFTFVLCLTSATPCGFRQHEDDDIDMEIHEEQAKMVKRQVVEAKVESSELLPQEPAKEVATLDPTDEGAELPENNAININNEEKSNDSLESSEGEGAGNGEIKEIKEIIPTMQPPQQQPKSETDVDVRPIPINHCHSPNTTVIGKIKTMFSKVKDWIVGS